MRTHPYRSQWSWPRRGFVTLILVSLAVFCLWSWQAAPQAQTRPTRRGNKSKVAAKPRVDYTKFSHTTHAVQQKLACNSCHKFPTKNWKEIRKSDAFPDVGEFPEHGACLNCHRQQFFARERPAPAICANCHPAVTPRDTARFLFPSLGETFLETAQGQKFSSEFQVAFPHDKHLDVVGANQRRGGMFVTASFHALPRRLADQPKSCPVCHQTYKPQAKSKDEYFTAPPPKLGDDFWLKKGTFRTTPVDHSACSACHSDESGIAPAPADCNACHKLFKRAPARSDFDPDLARKMGITDLFVLRKWPLRDLSATFRHEAHQDLSCSNCHNPNAMNLLEPRTMRVPIKSCGGADGCHITATLDDGGILNFEVDQRKTNPKFVCTKCHLKFGSEPVPESHALALAALKKN